MSMAFMNKGGGYLFFLILVKVSGEMPKYDAIMC
jgi:hypothetical protein